MLFSIEKSRNSLISSVSDSSSSSSSENTSSARNNESSSTESDSSNSNSDVNKINGSASLISKVDLNNLFNGVQTSLIKNCRKQKIKKVSKSSTTTVINRTEMIDDILNKRPCLKNLTNSVNCHNKQEDVGLKAVGGLSKSTLTKKTSALKDEVSFLKLIMI